MIKKLIWPISFILWCLVIYFTLSLLWQVMAEEPIPIVFGWGITTTTEEMGDTVPAGTLVTVNACGTYSADEIIIYLDAEKFPHLLRLSAEANGTTEDGFRIVGKIVHQFRSIPEVYDAVEEPAVDILMDLTNLLEGFFNWLASLFGTEPVPSETTAPPTI